MRISRYIGDRLITSAFWSLIGSIISRALGMLAAVISARILGIEAFGEFGLIRNTIMTFGILSGYSLGLSATKYISEFKNINPQKAGRTITLLTVANIILSSLVIIVLFFFAPNLGKLLNLTLNLKDSLLVAGLLLIANSYWTVQQSILTGFQEFRKNAINNLIYGVTLVSLTYLLSIVCGLIGTLLAYSISAFFCGILARFEVSRLCKKYSIVKSPRIQLEDIKILFSFSLPAFLSGVLVLPITWWCFLQVSSLPAGKLELGLYNAADQWRTVILFVPQAIGSVVLPLLSEAYGNKDKAQISKVVRSNFLANLAITSLLSILVICARKLISSFYGTGFDNASPIIVILSITAIFQSLSSIIGQIISSQGRMWLGLFVNLIWACVVVICSIYLFQPTAMGISMSFLWGYIVLFVCSFLLIRFNSSKLVLKNENHTIS